MTAWMGIESAPKDGTVFLGWWPETSSPLTGRDMNQYVCTTWFRDGKWHTPFESEDPGSPFAPSFWVPNFEPPMTQMRGARLPRPCPFCGSVEGPYVIGGDESSFVRCAICGAEGPDPDSGMSWDDRSPATINEISAKVTAPQPGMNEAVAAYCERYLTGPSRTIAWRAFTEGYLAAERAATNRTA